MRSPTKKASNIVKAIFIVCGQEKLILKESINNVFNINNNKNSEKPTLTYDLKKIWEVDTTGLVSSPQDCPITEYRLCNDAKCVTKAPETWYSF